MSVITLGELFKELAILQESKRRKQIDICMMVAEPDEAAEAA